MSNKNKVTDRIPAREAELATASGSRFPSAEWSKRYAETSLFGNTTEDFMAVRVPADINLGSGAHDAFVWGAKLRKNGMTKLPDHPMLTGGTWGSADRGMRQAEEHQGNP